MIKKALSDRTRRNVAVIVRDNIRPDALIEGTYYFDSEFGRIRGIVCLRHLSRYLTEVKHFFVREEYRGLGVGKELLDEVEKESTRPILCATVLEDNSVSRHIYAAAGYHEVDCFMQEDRRIILYMKKIQTAGAVN